MGGNVGEWCSDWYGEYRLGKNSKTSGRDPGEHRVLRGGSWNDTHSVCRTVDRVSREPENTDASNGFRIVRESLNPRPPKEPE